MELLKSFFKEEEGLATLEIVLIVVVLIGLALLFKDVINEFVGKVLGKVKKEADFDSKPTVIP